MAFASNGADDVFDGDSDDDVFGARSSIVA